MPLSLHLLSGLAASSLRPDAALQGEIIAIAASARNDCALDADRARLVERERERAGGRVHHQGDVVSLPPSAVRRLLGRRYAS